ncbi:MAG: SGNH/GDSL hydrolase family protein [Planctomycetota bacterium]|nr:SGNH/GDSL hydrolase family protein [Planctomycetota bacterium]
MEPSYLLYLGWKYVVALAVWCVGLVAGLLILVRIRQQRRSRRQSLGLVHGLLSLWMLSVLVTTAELYFAVIYDTTDSFSMTETSKRWFRKHVRLNEAGYRDGPLVRRLEDGVKRVAFVGDSFTFGHGVANAEDRFSDRIAADLASQTPLRFEVANLSRCGTGLIALRKLLESELQQRTQLDVVVYSICLNDIDDFQPAAEYADTSLNRPKFLVFKRSYLMNFLYFRCVQFTHPNVRDYFTEVKDLYAGDAWLKFAEELDQLHQLCRAHDASLRIVVFPFLHNLGPDYPMDLAHRRIVEYCVDRHVPCLDLAPELLPHVAEGLTVNSFDAHPNERAHALAATAIKRELLADLFE